MEVDPEVSKAIDSIRIDRTILTYANLHDPPDDLEYWRGRSYEERLEGIELLRQLNYGYDPDTARLQRFLEYAQLERR